MKKMSEELFEVEESAFLGNAIFVKHNRMLVKVEFDTIKWIESDGNYSTIVTCNKKYLVRKSLTRLMESLPDHQFIRLNKSCIACATLITQIDATNNMVYLGEIEMNLGRNYKKPLLDRLNLI